MKVDKNEMFVSLYNYGRKILYIIPLTYAIFLKENYFPWITQGNLSIV